MTAADEAPFTGLDVIYPNGGQTYNAGDSVTVSWASANINPSHDLYVFLHDGSTYHQQAGPLPPATTSWPWTVPSTATTNGSIYVGAWNGSEYDRGGFQRHRCLHGQRSRRDLLGRIRDRELRGLERGRTVAGDISGAGRAQFAGPVSRRRERSRMQDTSHRIQVTGSKSQDSGSIAHGS